MSLKKAKNSKGDPFNRALAVFLEWGPGQSIDVRLRIAQAMPKLRRTEVTRLLLEFESLRSASCRIVEDQVEKHQAEEDGRSRVAALDKRLSAENASLLYHQARYSAWRDGYR